MLLQSHSSMSSLSLTSPWFINDKACQRALPLCCCSKQILQWCCYDRYDVYVNECVTIYTRSQVDVLTCTFLSLPCSAVIAALQRRKYSQSLPLLFSASSAIPTEPVLLPPMSKMFLCIHSTWTMGSTVSMWQWHEPLHIPKQYFMSLPYKEYG